MLDAATDKPYSVGSGRDPGKVLLEHLELGHYATAKQLLQEYPMASRAVREKYRSAEQLGAHALTILIPHDRIIADWVLEDPEQAQRPETTGNGETLAHLAVRHHSSSAERAIRRPEIREIEEQWDGVLVAHEAVRHHGTAGQIALMDECIYQLEDQNGSTVAHYATLTPGGIDALLEHPPAWSLQDQKEETPLDWAARKKGGTKLIEQLERGHRSTRQLRAGVRALSEHNLDSLLDWLREKGGWLQERHPAVASSLLAHPRQEIRTAIFRTLSDYATRSTDRSMSPER